MAEPTNKKLYEKVKKEIYAKIPKHSAYRSGLLVKEYKKRGGKYSGEKPKKGLTRWFKEKWKTQDGKTTYQKKGDIFRPTKRVSKDTPTTMSELTKKQKEKAIKEKKATGRVKKYKK
tara:strand:+ start:1323 stop:1673 length:351 start_codon:yes stop_codon:yes gene_type:complete